MASFYVDDGTLTMFPRAGVAGREGIRAYFARSFAQRPAGMRHVTRLGEIDLIAPDIAVVEGYVRLEKVAPDGGTTLVRSFVSHSIRVRQDGTWLVRLVRMHVKPDAEVDAKFAS